MEPALETLVKQARDGDKTALEAVVRTIQDQVYGLAMWMLWHPADAEDATQEILIKIATCCISGNVTDEVIADYIANESRDQDEDFKIDG
jgi:hypothetical protein